MVVDAWLRRAAAFAPDTTAIETPQGSCSYAELLAAARAAAEALAARGVRPGERVAIALPPGLAFAHALHACLLLGAVAMPLDLRLSTSERAEIAAGAAVVVEEPLVEVEEPFVEQEGAAGVASPRALFAPAPELPATSSSSSSSSSSSGAAVHDLDAPAVVIHTSGTTAAPRPVELTYGNLLWGALGSAVALGLNPRERWLCALPLSHVGGLSILLRSAIYATTAVVHERFDTEPVLRALREQEITLVSLVATTLARLLDAGLQSPPTLRCALTGGGPVPTALLERAHAAAVPVALTYGLTESCAQATTTPLAALDEKQSQTELPEERESPTAGPPLFCTRVRIAPDGEILLAGPTIAPGSVAPDGWLHTGDAGRLDTEGRLYVTGRKADTIVTGGENVAPTEVEAVLEAHPDVVEAAVIGRTDPEWGEAVTALVVARAGAELQAPTLRAHCAARLAAYKVPKLIALVQGPLPRTRSGKLLRRELA